MKTKFKENTTKYLTNNHTKIQETTKISLHNTENVWLLYRVPNKAVFCYAVHLTLQ